MTVPNSLSSLTNSLESFKEGELDRDSETQKPLLFYGSLLFCLLNSSSFTEI